MTASVSDVLRDVIAVEIRHPCYGRLSIGDVLAHHPGRVQVIQMRSGVVRPTITLTLDATDRDLTTFTRLLEVPIPALLWPLRRVVYELFRRQDEQAVLALKRLLEGHASRPTRES
jgi:hypothetical protein